jgi:hypothetical protein
LSGATSRRRPIFGPRNRRPDPIRAFGERADQGISFEVTQT